MIRYVIIPCRTWEAVIDSTLISDDPDRTMRWAAALCQDRVDARVIAKRLNAKQASRRSK